MSTPQSAPSYPAVMPETLTAIMSPFTHVPVAPGSAEGASSMLNYYLNSDDENTLKRIQAQYAKTCKDAGREGGIISTPDFYKAIWGLLAFTMNIYVYGEPQREDGSEWSGRCEALKGFEAWLSQEAGFTVDDGLLLFTDFNEIEVYT